MTHVWVSIGVRTSLSVWTMVPLTSEGRLHTTTAKSLPQSPAIISKLLPQTIVASGYEQGVMRCTYRGL